MPHYTRFLSRLIGIYCLLVAVALGTNKQASVSMVAAFVHDAPLLYFAGAIVAIAGLAIVLNHNVWSGGALPVVVTVVGWVVLAKGAMLLFLSPDAESAIFLDGLHYERLFYLYCAIPFLLGAFLTRRGFASNA